MNNTQTSVLWEHDCMRESGVRYRVVPLRVRGAESGRKLHLTAAFTFHYPD